MTISRRAMLMIVSAGVLSGSLIAVTNAFSETAKIPGVNAACDGILNNAELNISTQGKIISMMLHNRSQVSLWVPQEKEPLYGYNTETKRATIWHGYSLEVHGGLAGHYRIPPMQKVGLKQKYRWKLNSSKLITAVMAPGFSIEVKVRVALRAFSASKNQEEAKRVLPTYLAESCVLKASAVVTPK